MAAPSRSWGWHELAPDAAAALVADAHVQRGALVLDIGAGLGAVTEHLLAAGAKVIAVEAHPTRARLLEERLGCRVVVVRADAARLRLPLRPYHVVANPPFAVTTPLLRRLLQPGTRLISAHLVLQQQAALRWSGPAAPGAARWQREFDVRLGRRLPRRAFTPPPGVDGRVLIVTRRVAVPRR